MTLPISSVESTCRRTRLRPRTMGWANLGATLLPLAARPAAGQSGRPRCWPSLSHSAPVAELVTISICPATLFLRHRPRYWRRWVFQRPRRRPRPLMRQSNCRSREFGAAPLLTAARHRHRRRQRCVMMGRGRDQGERGTSKSLHVSLPFVFVAWLAIYLDQGPGRLKPPISNS
jgi:hypothetical protein